MKVGFVSIVGRPNAGKSTLINSIIGSKVAIVSDKAHTTRNNIQGIYNDDDSQIIFIDTPGIHKPMHKLGKYMNSQSYYSIEDTNVILFMVDATEKIGKGDKFILEKLKEVDPSSAEIIHRNNIKRVIRALEYYHCTGKTISEKNDEEKNKEEIFDSYFFVITDDRQTLYDRIDKRVDKMMENGLLDEVNNLYKRGISQESTSMHGIGYSQLIPVIKGEDTLEHAVEIIKRDSRRYAKRQLTWFKREKNVIWIDRQNYNDNDEIADYISKKYLEE